MPEPQMLFLAVVVGVLAGATFVWGVVVVSLQDEARRDMAHIRALTRERDAALARARRWHAIAAAGHEAEAVSAHAAILPTRWTRPRLSPRVSLSKDPYVYDDGQATPAPRLAETWSGPPAPRPVAAPAARSRRSSGGSSRSGYAGDVGGAAVAGFDAGGWSSGDSGGGGGGDCGGGAM